MAEFPALPLWTDAYIGDTAHLTNEEHGVYLRLLMIAWRSPSCSLPDDDARLALMVGISTKKWKALRPTISAFWTIENGAWTQKRLTRERKFVRGKAEKNRSAAEARWQGKSLDNNNSDDADASSRHMPERCVNDAPTPTPFSVSKDTAATAAKDPAKVMFDSGISLLGAAGIPATKARPIIGKWKADHGAESVLVALGKAQREGAIDPVSFCQGIFRQDKKAKAPTIGEQRKNQHGETIEWGGDNAGWVKVWG